MTLNLTLNPNQFQPIKTKSWGDWNKPKKKKYLNDDETASIIPNQPKQTLTRSWKKLKKSLQNIMKNPKLFQNISQL